MISQRQYNYDALNLENYIATRLVVNVTELSKILGISRTSAYQLVKTPGFPSFEMCGEIHIGLDKLREWINEEVNKHGKEAR